MIAAHVVDLVSTVAELQKRAGNPLHFRLMAAELADSSRARRTRSPRGPALLAKPRGGGVNALERHGIDHLSPSSLNLWIDIDPVQKSKVEKADDRHRKPGSVQAGRNVPDRVRRRGMAGQSEGRSK
jgi:hypothetical protein